MSISSLTTAVSENLTAGPVYVYNQTLAGTTVMQPLIRAWNLTARGVAASTAAIATTKPTAPARSILQAEAADASEGTTTVTGNPGYVTDLQAGDYLRFSNVDFGSPAPKLLQVRVAAANNGGKIVAHVDSKTGPVIGEVVIGATGGLGTWTTATVPLFPTAAGATGKHSLFLTVEQATSTGSTTAFALDWVTFVDQQLQDATARIQAELFSRQSGTNLEDTTDVGGGRNVASVGNGDTVEYDDVSFGSTGSRAATLRYASAPGGGTVEMYVDSVTPTNKIGTLAIPTTGGWQNWRDGAISLDRTVTGTHRIILKAVGGAGDFVNYNWFSFAPILGSRDPYSAIQIEDYSRVAAGAVTQATSSGTVYVNSVNNGDVLEYDDVDFGSATAKTVTLTYGSATTAGNVGVYLDVIDSAHRVKLFPIAATGGWTTWKGSTYSLVQSATGRHKLICGPSTPIRATSLTWTKCSSRADAQRCTPIEPPENGLAP